MELLRVRYNCATLTFGHHRVSVMAAPEELDALEKELANKGLTANAQKQTALGMPKLDFAQPARNGRANGSGTRAVAVAANAAAGGQGGQGKETALGIPRIKW